MQITRLIGRPPSSSAKIPVLPLAIDRRVEVAAASRGPSGVEARSLLSPDLVELDWNSAGEDDLRAPGGGSLSPYLRGVMRVLETKAQGRGAQLAVVSDLPSAGGLSSSSALTVAMIAALDSVWELGLDAEDVAETAIRAERHVGVESGGMDQTAIVFGRADHALRIDFAPPARRHVPIDDELRIVVASSGTAAAKGRGVRDAYNARVVGCRVAAALMLHHMGVAPEGSPRLCEVAGRNSEPFSELDVAALPERIRPSDAARRSGLPLDALVVLSAATFEANAALPVRAYARHVLSEAARVDVFERALLERDADSLGSLLDTSHESLARDFECSTPALDRLCEALRGAGALGARLTGAGFGGYALALCRPNAVDAVITAAIATTGGPAFEVCASDGWSAEQLSGDDAVTQAES